MAPAIILWSIPREDRLRGSVNHLVRSLVKARPSRLDLSPLGQVGLEMCCVMFLSAAHLKAVVPRGWDLFDQDGWWSLKSPTTRALHPIGML